MATFSTNQVRQLYVANELKTPKVATTDKAGAIAVKTDKNKTHLYFEYMGAGGMTRSDLIDIKNIVYVKSTDADKLAHNLAKYKLTLDKSVNEGKPAAEQDYILKVIFKDYLGSSSDTPYFKYGTVHTYVNMTASDFYKSLAMSLVKNMGREDKLLKIYLETGGTKEDTVAGSPTEVTLDTKESTLTGTYTGVVIEEAPQKWVLGLVSQISTNFTLQPSPIFADGGERVWGIAKKVESTSKIENGQMIADLEYFCMGERGDIYREAGFPNVIRTKYLVNPENKYNVIDIHYFYKGSNESSQYSEKDITIVAPKMGDNNQTSNKLINDIITAIKTATGLTVETLDVSGK